MIKDITSFPRLNAVQQYSNLKEIDRLCSEGIKEMEDQLWALSQDIQNAFTDEEQELIVSEIVACNLHMSVCESSKLVIEGDLNRLSFIYN